MLDILRLHKEHCTFFVCYYQHYSKAPFVRLTNSRELSAHSASSFYYYVIVRLTRRHNNEAEALVKLVPFRCEIAA